jgi:hypothetical protein
MNGGLNLLKFFLGFTGKCEVKFERLLPALAVALQFIIIVREEYLKATALAVVAVVVAESFF